MAASPPPASMEAVFPGPSGKVGRTAHASQASPWSRRVETCVLSYGFPAPPSRGEGAGLRCPQPGLALLTRVSLSSLQRACEFGPLFRLFPPITLFTFIDFQLSPGRAGLPGITSTDHR